VTDDDPELESLRAIWGSMRDEDPPDRGLAALMAAARDKAEEMKPREAWWQRLFAQLRRPPVLALAMLVLLVGGGVIISQRDDVQSRAVSEEHEGHMGRPASTTAPAATPAMDSAAEGRGAAAAAESESADMPAPITPPASADKAAPPPTSRPAPRQPTPPKAKAELKKDARAATTLSGAGTAGGAYGGPRGATKPAMSIATDEAPAAESPPPPPPMTPAPKAQKADVAPSIDELIKQCEAAAARGDCATAKRLATKIEQADAEAFRARVAPNAKIKACL
jgi:hypothetical protein